MTRLFRSVLLLLLVLVAGAGGYAAYKDPEHRTLDAAARTGVPGQFVTLAAGVTHYEISGPPSGRVVVLVHGFSVPAYIWDSTFKALGDAGYRVLRYDVFGRGWSDRPNGAYDGAMYDEQLNGLLDSLKINEPVDLIGLSFGGYVTAHYVASHAKRVNTLTLIDPVAVSRKMPSMLAIPVIGSWIWQATQVPGMADNQASDFLHPEHFPTWADQYRPQMQFKGFGRALLRSAFVSSRTDFRSLYTGVAVTKVPVLLMWGRQDQTVPIERSEVIRSSIPSAEFVPIDSAGHLPHIEQSAQVHARLLTFLTAHPLPVVRTM
jgi:pimeloyl-ACP methyl ester carboxylesterase